MTVLNFTQHYHIPHCLWVCKRRTSLSDLQFHMVTDSLLHHNAQNVLVDFKIGEIHPSSLWNNPFSFNFKMNQTAITIWKYICFNIFGISWWETSAEPGWSFSSVKKKRKKTKKKKKPSLLFNKSSASCFFRDHEWSLKLKATDSKTHTTQTQVELFLYANFFKRFSLHRILFIFIHSLLKLLWNNLKYANTLITI